MSETPRSEQIEQEPKVEIIEYSDAYKNQVRKLIGEIYENELGWHGGNGRPDLDKIDEIYQKDAGNFWVALDNGRVVGSIALIDEGGSMGSMHRFCVEKEFRGEDKGVSGGLFSNFIEFARKENFKKIFIATRKGAVGANKFYIKYKCKPIKFESLPKDVSGRSYVEEDDILYELDLDERNDKK